MCEAADVTCLEDQSTRKFASDRKIDELGIWSFQLAVKAPSNLLQRIVQRAHRGSEWEWGGRCRIGENAVRTGYRNVLHARVPHTAINGLNGSRIGDYGSQSKR